MKLASLFLVLIFFFSLVLALSAVNAQQMSDDDFIIYPDVQGSSGGNVTDSSFDLEFTAGQPTVENTTDSEYTIHWGFWAPNGTVISVAAAANTNPYYKEWVPLILSYIDRDKNNPAPGETVNFWVYVYDDEQVNTTLNVTFYWRTTPIWNSQQMTYNYPIAGVYGLNFNEPSIVAKTTMWYYVNASDEASGEELYNVTPVTLQDTLYWDNPPVGTTSPGTGTGGGGGGGGTTPAGNGKIEIMEYPTSIIIEQGGLEYEYVKIKNTGDGTLTDVYVTLEGIDLNWYTVDPVETDVNPDDEVTFIIKFKIPDDAEKKAYKFFVHVGSDQDTEREASELDIIDWPKGDIIKIDDIEIPELRVNTESTIKVIVENTLFRDKNVTLSLIVPGAWNLNPEEATRNIPSYDKTIYEFKMTPKTPGVFGIILIGRYDDKQFSEDIIVNVRELYEYESIPFWWSLILAIIVIVLLTIAIILYYRHKKKALREVTDEKRMLIHKEVKDLKNKVLKPKLSVKEKERLEEILKSLEKARKEGLITEHIYYKSRQKIIKKLRGGD
ncbi:MAG: hypothetical protein ABIF08_00705 [Nanoarchaeota archaeon]